MFTLIKLVNYLSIGQSMVLTKTRDYKQAKSDTKRVLENLTATFHLYCRKKNKTI